MVGRDQQDQILYLKKDPETQIWNLERMETEPHKEPPDPVLEAVAKLVSAERQEWTGSPSELATTVQVGMAANALTKYLNVKSGRLLEEYHVGYENRARHAGRQVKLTYMLVEAPAFEVVEDGATVATVATVKMLPPKQPSLSSQPSRKGTKRMKNVQIPYDLFVALVEYHLGYDDEYEDEIRQGLEQKLDALVRHELYAKYKDRSQHGRTGTGPAGVSGPVRRVPGFSLVTGVYFHTNSRR